MFFFAFVLKKKTWPQKKLYFLQILLQAEILIVLCYFLASDSNPISNGSYIFEILVLIETVLRVPRWPVGHAQRRTIVEIIGGDESLHHQPKRQDRVNFWGAPPPRPPPFIFFARYLVSIVLRL